MKNHLLPLLSAAAILLAPAAQAAEVLSSGVSAVDIPVSSAKSVTLDIEDGQFSDYLAQRITLTARGIDFREGTLSGLTTNVHHATFDQIRFDDLRLQTGPFSFNTMELLNRQRFVLDQAVTANVELRITEQDLNFFIQHPATLSKIEQAIAKKTGGLNLISFSQPRIDLLGGGNIRLYVTSLVAQGLAVPMEMSGKLALKNGDLALSNLKLVSQKEEVPLPVNITGPFQDRLNEMISFKKLGKKSMVINGTSMNMTRDQLTVTGTAALTRLEFGK